jgi:hypothetical protein
VNPDSLYYLEIFDYDPGSNYFFQIFFSNILEGDFTIYSNTVPPGASCPPSLSCSLVRNFSFEDYYQNIVPANAFHSGQVCHWGRAWGTPTFSGLGVNANGAYMWTTYEPQAFEIQSEAIFQEGLNLQPNIEYTLTYDYYPSLTNMEINVGLTNYYLPAPYTFNNVDPVPSGFTMYDIGTINLQTVNATANSWNHYNQNLSLSFTPNSNYYRLVIYPETPLYWGWNSLPWVVIDNIVIKPKLIFQNLQSPQTISCGSSVYMQPTVPTANIVSWQWTSNQTSGVISNSQNFQVSPLVTTTYTVTATDANQCTWTGEFVVNVVPLQTLPLTINLNWGKTCSEYANFTFTLPSSPVIDHTTWFVPNNAVITTTNALNDIIVNWNNAGIATITVQGFSANGCLIYEGSLLVNPNQNPSTATYYINNLNATQIKQMFGIIAPNLSITNIQDIINIDGTIVINENLTFASCTNVILGLNAKIIVMPGCTLSIASSHFSASECKWDGIFVENPTARLIVQNSFISGAKNAVVSGYDGKIYLYNTIFSDNLLGVWVRKYNPELIPDQNGGWILPPAHNAYIGKCRFELSTNNTELLLGIKADTVYNLTIGDVNTAGNTNEFYKMRTSIISNSSDVNIYNNYFNTNFYSNEPNPYYFSAEPWDAAIFIKRPYDPNPPQVNYYAIQNIVTIGGSATNQPNAFYLQNVGVYGFSTQVHVRNNTFTEQRFSAVHLKDLYNSDINYNSITMQTSLSATNNLYNSSLLAEHTVASYQLKLNITNNTINNARTAIYTRNCNGTSLGYEYCNIAFNMINFEGLGTSAIPFIGINSSSCNYANIEQNTIQYNPTTTPNYVADYDKLKGISVATVQNAKVRKNILVRLGIGIWGADNLLGTQFFCNDLDKNYYGFFFLQGVTQISDQNSSSSGGRLQASDNYWYDNPNFTSSEMRRIGGRITNFTKNWYHRGSNIDITNIFSPYIISSLQLPWGYIIPIGGVTANPDCNIQVTPVTSPKAREEALGDIVKDSVIYEAYQSENRYYAEDFAYKLIDETPALLNMGVAEDSIYQQFYNENKIKSIGKFADIDKYIFNAQYADAIQLNNTVIPINLMETHKKAINHIYLQTIVNNQIISSSDSITLYNIANQLPFYGGDAVYSARVILGLDPANLNLDYAKVLQKQVILNIESEAVRLYPNPVSDIVNLIFNSETVGNAVFELYDMSNRKLLMQKIPPKTIEYTINLINIKSGIYYCRISNKTGVLLKSKLIINCK